MPDLNFVVTNRAQSHRTAGDFVLAKDNWNDYGYYTQFVLYYNNENEQIEIGYVKIANSGMRAKYQYGGGTPSSTNISPNFDELEPNTFSLGQDREYYENLQTLPDGIGQRALHALNDIAYDLTLFNKFKDEDVLQTSLMRSLKDLTVKTQFHRIATGNPVLSPYRFSFGMQENTENHNSSGFRIRFMVDPDQFPPTNMHVIIGSNGVGKSRLLRNLVKAIAYPSSGDTGTLYDEFEGTINNHKDLPFAGIVHIGFSAFESDQVVELDDQAKETVKLVGLTSDRQSLTEQYIESLQRCQTGPRRLRWLAAMRTLSSADAILAEIDFDNLLTVPKPENEKIFSAMSSGHKIVVLTMSRLVELVEERTLVLLDEPETHLHPPLLSALTRSISDLMVDRNGVAIIATHSPVVLQEVPRSCVSVLRRTGSDFRVWELDTESFGESVSRLTTEVFHLEVGRTGYHQLLDQLLKEHQWDPEKVIDTLRGQLGSEGRFVLNALANKSGLNA